MSANEDAAPWTLSLSSHQKAGDAPISGWTATGVDATKLSVTVNSGNVATFVLVPDAYGQTSVTFILSDEDGLRASQPVNININNVNDPPRIESTPSTGARVGQQYRYEVIVVDPDPDTITYHLLSGPEGMAFDNGIVTWTPQEASSRNVNLEVRDGKEKARQNFVVTALE